MTISFVNEAHQYQYYAGSLTISKPTGTTSGDLLIAVIGGTKSSTPSGWTQLSDVDSGGSSTGHVYVYYKIAGGSEPSSYTFNQSGSSSFYTPGAILCYRGIDGTTPIDTSHSSSSGMSGGGTDYTTATVTASGTQWALSYALAYQSGSTTVRTFTEGSGSERLDFGNGQSSETTSLMVCDSNGNVSAGSFSRTQTASASTAKGAKGIVLINDSGVSVPVGTDGVAHATTAAQQPTILIQTVQSAAASTAAHNTSVDLEAGADVADDSTAVAHDALRPMLPPGAQAADVDAETASIHLDVNARLSSAEATAYNASGYYGAAVVRVYVVPDENRTFKVQR